MSRIQLFIYITLFFSKLGDKGKGKRFQVVKLSSGPTEEVSLNVYINVVDMGSDLFKTITASTIYSRLNDIGNLEIFEKLNKNRAIDSLVYL